LTHEPWIHSADGVIVDVRLTPRGSRDAIEGIERRADGRVVLKARVRAAPFEGQANTALCRLIADVLHTAPRQVTLVGGSTARAKQIRITGAADAIVEKLQRLAKVAS
jgi:uncharacterized protein